MNVSDEIWEEIQDEVPVEVKVSEITHREGKIIQLYSNITA